MKAQGRMLLSIQFPLADTRTFIYPEPRLHKPGWPLAEKDSEYVRYAGVIRGRTAGGLAGWGGENEGVICKANNALVFDKNISYLNNTLGINLILRRAFTYFYFDGTAVGKYELGVASKSKYNVQISPKQFPAVVNHFLTLPVRVRSPFGETKVQDLAQAGRSIAQLYAIASTSKEKEIIQSGVREVHPGTPILYFEFKIGEATGVPQAAKFVPLPKEYGIYLFNYKIFYKGAQIQSWLAFIDGKTNLDRARTLRLYLLRLHSEYECLRIILRNIKEKIINPPPKGDLSQKLQGYLGKAAANISNLENKCEGQFAGELPYIARNATNMTRPGDLEELLGIIQDLDLRGNIARNTGDFVRSDGNLKPSDHDIFYINSKEVKIMTGDNINVNQAIGSNIGGQNNQITNTFGTITNTINSMPNGTQADKEELTKLVQQLAEALKKAPADQQEAAENVSKATKRVVDAAAEEKPDKQWFSVTAEGLKKAAENIKAVLPDVLTIATSIITKAALVIGLHLPI